MLTSVEKARKVLRQNGLEFIPPTEYSRRRLRIAEMDCAIDLEDTFEGKRRINEVMMRYVARHRILSMQGK